MTTHLVEIRLRHAGNDAPWEALTHAPVAHGDAQRLCGQIGPAWDRRVVLAARSPVEVDRATMLERLALVTHVPQTLIDMQRELAMEHVNDHDRYVIREATIDCVRNGLFGIFEKYRGAQAFTRWRAEDHKVDHKRGCKGKFHVTERAVAELAGARWTMRQEMEERVRYLNEHSIPGIGIVAVAEVLTPKLHQVMCKKCERSSEAVSIVVQIQWHPNADSEVTIMRREYQL